jgi:hypothetical protein
MRTQNVRWKIIFIKKREEEVEAMKKAGLVPLTSEFEWIKTFQDANDYGLKVRMTMGSRYCFSKIGCVFYSWRNFPRFQTRIPRFVFLFAGSNIFLDFKRGVQGLFFFLLGLIFIFLASPRFVFHSLILIFF